MHGILERSSLCFFCLAGARNLRAGGADSVKPCPTTGGHPKGGTGLYLPKGLGLEGIRGAGYACNVPAKQKRMRNLSGIRDKLKSRSFPTTPLMALVIWP